MIEQQNRVTKHIGDGMRTTFPFTFKVLQPTHIKVALDVNGADHFIEYGWEYTVSLGVGEGGTVTIIAPPAAGQKIAIISAQPNKQEMNLTNQGAFSPVVLNNTADVRTIASQQNQEKVDRAVKVPYTSDETPEEFVNSVFAARDQAQQSATAAANSATAAANSATSAANSAQQAANKLNEVITAGNTAVANINTARANGLAAIESARLGALNNIASARSGSLNDIDLARLAALNQINTTGQQHVDAAEQAADNSAESARQSAGSAAAAEQAKEDTFAALAVAQNLRYMGQYNAVTSYVNGNAVSFTQTKTSAGTSRTFTYAYAAKGDTIGNAPVINGVGKPVSSAYWEPILDPDVGGETIIAYLEVASFVGAALDAQMPGIGFRAFHSTNTANGSPVNNEEFTGTIHRTDNFSFAIVAIEQAPPAGATPRVFFTAAHGAGSVGTPTWSQVTDKNYVDNLINAIQNSTYLFGLWFGKTNAATAVPLPTRKEQNYIDFTTNTVYNARDDLSGWDVREAITPRNGLVVGVSSQFWDLVEDAGRPGQAVYSSEIGGWDYLPYKLPAFATNAEAIAGIVSNKIVAPSALKATLDSFNDLIHTLVIASDLNMNNAPANSTVLFAGLNTGSYNWPPVLNNTNTAWSVTTVMDVPRGRGTQTAVGADVTNSGVVWSRSRTSGTWSRWFNQKPVMRREADHTFSVARTIAPKATTLVAGSGYVAQQGVLSQTAVCQIAVYNPGDIDAWGSTALCFATDSGVDLDLFTFSTLFNPHTKQLLNLRLPVPRYTDYSSVYAKVSAYNDWDAATVGLSFAGVIYVEVMRDNVL